MYLIIAKVISHFMMPDANYQGPCHDVFCMQSCKSEPGPIINYYAQKKSIKYIACN